MLFQQHKLVGNKIWVGANVSIPGRPEAVGRILFSRVERIALSDPELHEELKPYNASLAGVSVDEFRERVEKGKLKLEVRRSFGMVNAWAGDHAKLNPPNGQLRRFADLHVELQHVKQSINIEYFKLATSNWDHFMPLAVRVWLEFHREAIRLARKWAREHGGEPGYRAETAPSGDRALIFDLDGADVARALFLEGYAAHFLEDCFVSGHLRTPRLAFGPEVIHGLVSKEMHDEDNERRLESTNAKGERFRLCGEDEDKDDFVKRAGDQDLQRLLGEVTGALAASVQQVIDVAFGGLMPAAVRYEDVTDRMPRVEIWWRPLAEDRGHTHALEMWPKPGAADVPKPLYKIHANWSARKKRFTDPALVKRTDDGSWRVSWLIDVDGFTPGEKLAWWIPVTPDGKMTLP
jgi:hypothetical protein